MMADDMQAGPAGAEPVFRAVVITDPGRRKIEFIKLLRQYTDLGLKDAKEVAEKPPPFVLVICDESRAKEFQAAATAIGVSCALTDYDDATMPIIANEQPFGFRGASKGGCSTKVVALVVAAGGLGYGLALLLAAL